MNKKQFTVELQGAYVGTLSTILPTLQTYFKTSLNPTKDPLLYVERINSFLPQSIMFGVAYTRQGTSKLKLKDILMFITATNTEYDLFDFFPYSEYMRILDMLGVAYTDPMKFTVVIKY